MLIYRMTTHAPTRTRMKALMHVWGYFMSLYRKHPFVWIYQTLFLCPTVIGHVGCRCSKYHCHGRICSYIFEETLHIVKS